MRKLCPICAKMESMDIDLEALFSLDSPAGLPRPAVSPAYDESSLKFLEGIRRAKSESLKLLIAESGWPNAARVGEHAEAAAFMIAQHADYDPGFQIMCHDLMLEAAESGITKLGFLAFLTDRILCNHGKHQRFGTQIREVENGCFVPQPIENPDRVDELRELAGLDETLSEYYDRINRGDLLLYRPLLGSQAEELTRLHDEKIVPLFPEMH